MLIARFSDDDAPNTTDIQLEESAAGNTDVEAIIVMDGISDAWVRVRVRSMASAQVLTQVYTTSWLFSKRNGLRGWLQSGAQHTKSMAVEKTPEPW